MTGKIVYQTDTAGLFVGKTWADLSPKEKDVYHIPKGCVEAPPPNDWSDDVWPRWDGAEWVLIPKPKVQVPLTAEQKLAEFLQSNPDVLKLIEKDPIL